MTFTRSGIFLKRKTADYENTLLLSEKDLTYFVRKLEI
jgi:hypothetical protein